MDAANSQDMLVGRGVFLVSNALPSLACEAPFMLDVDVG